MATNYLQLLSPSDSRQSCLPNGFAVFRRGLRYVGDCNGRYEDIANFEHYFAQFLEMIPDTVIVTVYGEIETIPELDWYYFH